MNSKGEKAAPGAGIVRALSSEGKAGVPEQLDGRRRRADTSRARIVEAVTLLVREGHHTPGAARVAELAGVSLRTVFRHFDDMDSLFREIADSIQAQVLPAFFRPYRSEAWEDRLFEMIDRRIELFEAILPFKVPGDLKRFQSEFLSKDYDQHLKLEKMSLEALLPPAVLADRVLVQGLLVPAGFQGWRILRKDQELDVTEARAVVVRIVKALLASCQQESDLPSRRDSPGGAR